MATTDHELFLFLSTLEAFLSKQFSRLNKTENAIKDHSSSRPPTWWSGAGDFAAVSRETQVSVFVATDLARLGGNAPKDKNPESLHL